MLTLIFIFFYGILFGVTSFVCMSAGELPTLKMIREESHARFEYIILVIIFHQMLVVKFFWDIIKDTRLGKWLTEEIF